MTKVLFVCRSNAARSQMAKELYNQLEPNSADAAGVAVDQPGQKLKDKARSPYIFQVMDELGVDMRENARWPLRGDKLSQYKTIVLMLDDPDQIPPYLKNDPRVEIWDIKDPKFMNLNETIEVKEQIKKRVLRLKRTSL